MAIFNLSSSRTSDWNTLYANALAGTNIWPQKNGSPLPYRMTEASAYNNGGGNPNGQNFSTALWELDFCHWFARHNCTGVNPFTRFSDYSAPIFLGADGNYVAEPYAYGLMAFGLGGQGTCINASGVLVTNVSNVNLTAYAVINGNDLYVTLINKTFQTIGANAAQVTIEKPTGGFSPTNAACLVLTSGSSGEGDATALGTATLGGAVIPTSGDWNGTSVPLTVSNGVCTVTVQPCTAVIVDLHQ